MCWMATCTCHIWQHALKAGWGPASALSCVKGMSEIGHSCLPMLPWFLSTEFELSTDWFAHCFTGCPKHGTDVSVSSWWKCGAKAGSSSAHAPLSLPVSPLTLAHGLLGGKWWEAHGPADSQEMVCRSCLFSLGLVASLWGGCVLGCSCHLHIGLVVAQGQCRGCTFPPKSCMNPSQMPGKVFWPVWIRPDYLSSSTAGAGGLFQGQKLVRHFLSAGRTSPTRAPIGGYGGSASTSPSSWCSFSWPHPPSSCPLWISSMLPSPSTRWTWVTLAGKRLRVWGGRDRGLQDPEPEGPSTQLIWTSEAEEGMTMFITVP